MQILGWSSFHKRRTSFTKKLETCKQLVSFFFKNNGTFVPLLDKQLTNTIFDAKSDPKSLINCLYLCTFHLFLLHLSLRNRITGK